jgi:nucleoid-associated protein YgaU
MQPKTARAILKADWGQGRTEDYPVQYNPNELTFEKAATYGEIAIPGLDAPLQQFVRGGAETLSVELFFDTTDSGMARGARSVTEETDKVFRLVRVDGSSHAPPVVTFSWNPKFPGSGITAPSGGGGKGGNQNRPSFKGVVKSIRQRFTLFSNEGIPLRATLTLTLVEFRPLDKQLKELGLSSPDKTHGHVLAERETLSGIASRYYGAPRSWRSIARENGIEDPRRLQPGRLLSVPAITGGRR